VVATDSPTGPITVLDDSGPTKFAADVAGRNFPDRWRHSDATRLLRHGKDIHVAQCLLGHADIAATIRYLHPSDADLMDAVDRAFPAA
jgi:site-specific recombinase XerD